MGSSQTATKIGWRRGPSWGAVVLALLVLGMTTAYLGLDAAFFAEYGARSTCGGGWGYAPGSEELEGDPERPVTVTLIEQCEVGQGKTHTFTGTRQDANEWREQTLHRLAAERELPAVRSKLSSMGGRLFLVGAGVFLVALALGVGWAIARTMGRRHRVPKQRDRERRRLFSPPRPTHPLSER